MAAYLYPVEAQMLGECWMKVSRLILEQGHAAEYYGKKILHINRLTTSVELPDP